MVVAGHWTTKRNVADHLLQSYMQKPVGDVFLALVNKGPSAETKMAAFPKLSGFFSGSTSIPR